MFKIFFVISDNKKYNLQKKKLILIKDLFFVKNFVLLSNLRQ